jgi:hypothetical protein
LKSASKSILKTFTEKKLRGHPTSDQHSKINNHQSAIERLKMRLNEQYWAGRPCLLDARSPDP